MMRMDTGNILIQIYLPRHLLNANLFHHVVSYDHVYRRKVTGFALDVLAILNTIAKEAKKLCSHMVEKAQYRERGQV